MITTRLRSAATGRLRTSRRLAAAVAATAATALLAAGCSPAASPSATPASASPSAPATTTIDVFASTNVWGSVIAAVGGSHVDVHEVITSSAQDPHDYEATATDKLAASKAQLAIVNGGGYDDWASTLLKSSTSSPVVIDAVDVSGLKSGSGDFNEHVFFSLATAKKVADTAAAELGRIDAASAAEFTANAQKFNASIDEELTKAKAVGAGKNLTAVATEPVVGYLLADMGIKDITPSAFVEQAETEAGPSAAVLKTTTDLLTNKKASVLVLNGQTEDPVSDKLNKAAAAANIPVVQVSETFPDGVTDYIGFVSGTIAAFSSALA